MLIGELAEKSGFSRHTLRYYEKQGLLTARSFSRLSNNYRDYPQAALEGLAHIRQLKDLGFTLAEMKDLFDELSHSGQPCRSLPAQLDSKIDALDRQMAQLRQLRCRMTQVKTHCAGDCRQTRELPDCLSAQCC